MKLSLVAAASLLHLWFGEAFVLEDAAPSVRIHPRALALDKRAGRDCGKFVMFCEKAAAACNNACYHINCIDKNSATMVYSIPARSRNRVILLMVAATPAMMLATTTKTIVCSLGARLQMAVFVTPCLSVKSSTIP